MRAKSGPLSKISPPVLAGVLHRPRLYRWVDRLRARRVLWLTAPPGSGKTTLVSSYLAARRLPALWYQVDPGDTDPATLFYYLGLAARKTAPKTTRGWAAGMILLLQRSGDDGVTATCGGASSKETIFAYFAGEVFDKLDAAHQQALLDTAWLPQVTVKAAKHLSGAHAHFCLEIFAS